jgi:hypothetical protein
MRNRAFIAVGALLLLLVCLRPGWAQSGSGTASSDGAQTTSAPLPAAQTADNGQSDDAAQPANQGQSYPPDSSSDSSSKSKKGSKDKKDQASADASNPDYVPQSDDPDKAKHDGGKNDVDAIGNRKMGNKGLGNWYSIESEVRLGKQLSQQVEASVKLVQDPVVNEYINRVGQNLVRNSDAKVPFTIKVIDAEEINAFALPGGFFYVNSGLIMAADEEAEIAGVMAHEIAHVAARHAMRQQTRGNIANIASIPLIFMGGGIGIAARSAASLALPMSFLSFSRGFEAEADYLGLQYMYKAGYDPQSFISFFEKIQAKEKKKPGTLAKAFSTHPQTPDRIEKSQEEIQHVLPARDQYIVSTSEFDDVKARLAAIENRKKVIDKKDSNQPTLRRTAQDRRPGAGQDSSSGGTNDDDHPTLKRRADD